MKKHERMMQLAAQFSGSGVDPHYAGYFALFNQQKFYESHDVLEDLWLADKRGANGNFYKGLIQLAGAFVHLQKNRLRPSAALFKLARTNLEKFPRAYEHLDLDCVLRLIQNWLHDLEKNNFETNPLSEKNFPKLELQK